MARLGNAQELLTVTNAWANLLPKNWTRFWKRFPNRTSTQKWAMIFQLRAKRNARITQSLRLHASCWMCAASTLGGVHRPSSRCIPHPLQERSRRASDLGFCPVQLTTFLKIWNRKNYFLGFKQKDTIHIIINPITKHKALIRLFCTKSQLSPTRPKIINPTISIKISFKRVPALSLFWLYYIIKKYFVYGQKNIISIFRKT